MMNKVLTFNIKTGCCLFYDTIILQWEQSSPISPRFPGRPPLCLLPIGFVSVDNIVRTDWATQGFIDGCVF